MHTPEQCPAATTTEGHIQKHSKFQSQLTHLLACSQKHAKTLFWTTLIHFRNVSVSQKVPTSFVTSIHQSGCLHVSTCLPLDRFSLNFILKTVMKICKKSKFSYNWTKYQAYSYNKTNEMH